MSKRALYQDPGHTSNWDPSFQKRASIIITFFVAGASFQGSMGQYLRASIRINIHSVILGVFPSVHIGSYCSFSLRAAFTAAKMSLTGKSVPVSSSYA